MEKTPLKKGILKKVGFIGTLKKPEVTLVKNLSHKTDGKSIETNILEANLKNLSKV